MTVCQHGAPLNFFCSACYEQRGGVLPVNDTDQTSVEELYDTLDAMQRDNQILHEAMDAGDAQKTRRRETKEVRVLWPWERS